MSRAWPAAIVGSVLLSGAMLSGCGYHTGGHAVTLPAEIRTIAVPAFTSNTRIFKIEQTLTAAVVHELVIRTDYHILNATSDDADATLMGTVLSTASTPLTYDSQTGRMASALIVVTMKVVLTDRQGKTLYQNPSYIFREQYQVSSDLRTFFEEDSPAYERLARDFAKSLVSNLLEGF